MEIENKREIYKLLILRFCYSAQELDNQANPILSFNSTNLLNQ